MRAATVASARRAALFERVAHALDRLRDVPLHPLQVPAGERDEPHVRLRGHRRVAERLLEEAHLAEEIARPEVGDVLAVPGHLRLALLDRHELVGEVALANKLASLVDRDLLRERRDLPELFLGYVLEEGDRLEPACVQRVLLVSANSVAATLPTDRNPRAARRSGQVETNQAITVALSAGRAAFGMALVGAPARIGSSWLGPDGERHATHVALR